MRFGMSGLDTFPMTHQSAKKILGFASELLSEDNRYKVSEDGVPSGHHAIRVVGKKIFAIVSTINASFFTLSLGHTDYDRLAGTALASLVDQDHSNSKASGSLFIIEWNAKEAPCMRLSQTISYDQSNQLAKQWFDDVKSGIQHQCSWDKYADPEKPGVKGGGLTVLGLFESVNAKWHISTSEISFTSKNNVSLQTCYSLYLGQKVETKIINSFVDSQAPLAMIYESGFCLDVRRKCNINPALRNKLYPLINLLIARDFRAKGIQMDNKDHWAFKIGRLCNIVSWMQSRSYELRNMETTVRPLGLNLISHAYISPIKALERLVVRSTPIRKTLETLAIRYSSSEEGSHEYKISQEARKATNTFDKTYNELADMLDKIPVKAAKLDKLLMTSGFCHKNYASGSEMPKTTEPLAELTT